MTTSIAPHEGLRYFSRSISSQPMGLARYAPEPWAVAYHCFANAIRKAEQDGGDTCFGWSFLYRILPGLDGHGYLVATHHAVWHSPGGSLIDVTPFHEDKLHHPITQNGDVLFLVDDAAQPVECGNRIAPLPLRYFPLSDAQRLLKRLAEYQEVEERRCQKIYSGEGDVAGDIAD